MALAGLIAAGRMGTAINISNRPFELLQPLRKRGLTGGQVVDCGEEFILAALQKKAVFFDPLKGTGPSRIGRMSFAHSRFLPLPAIAAVVRLGHHETTCRLCDAAAGHALPGR